MNRDNRPPTSDTRHQIIIFLSLWSVVCALLSVAVSGCSEQYIVERMLWQADKAARPVLINEGSVSQYEFKKAVSLYEKIVARDPNSDYALDAQFKIARLYQTKKMFDKARQVYDKILQSHQGRQEVGALALFSKGQTFEFEGNWPEALIIFNEILIDFKRTKQSLSVPLYIARYYVRNKDQLAASAAYKAAVRFYQDISKEYPNTKAALMAENLIVKIYVEQNNWAGAVKYIHSMENKYKLGPETLMELAGIYKDKLNDKKKAYQIYNRILDDFPDYEGRQYVKEQMELLN